MPRRKFWRRGVAKKGSCVVKRENLTVDVDMGTPPTKKAQNDDMGTPPTKKAHMTKWVRPPQRLRNSSQI